MGTSNVRISQAAHQRLRELAQNERTSMQTVIERALESYRRQRFLAAANRQYAALRADGAAWTQELADRELWDRAGADGINDDD